MSGDQKKNNEWGSWALIIFLFAVGAWFLALPLLFMKLFASDGGSVRRRTTFGESGSRIPYRQQSTQAQTAQEQAQWAERAGQHANRAEKFARQVTKTPALTSSSSKKLKFFGLILAAIGLALASDPAGMVFRGYVEYFLWNMMKYLAITAGGMGMFFSGVSMDRAMQRYARYLAVMGDQESVAVTELARKLGYTGKRVEKDLQKMIEKGYFGGQAYLNVALGYFFRSSQADAAFEQKQREESAQPPKEAEEGYSGILRNIRRANDRIADPVLSQKIDRLEAITAKIFRAVEEDPKKRSRISTFMDYYLPTTQKLLDTYAEFEETGVEGENLRQSKEHIEQMMDSIIEGFEHQLDSLYQSDAMDVDSDIRVMEAMLHRDTASVEKDFGLKGGASAPSGTAPNAAEKPAQNAAASAAPAPKDIDLGGVAAQKEG
jgi:5-bromo-4-chloroindolyl phosphate hydrolysis protein.